MLKGAEYEFVLPINVKMLTIVRSVAFLLRYSI